MIASYHVVEAVSFEYHQLSKWPIATDVDELVVTCTVMHNYFRSSSLPMQSGKQYVVKDLKTDWCCGINGEARLVTTGIVSHIFDLNFGLHMMLTFSYLFPLPHSQPHTQLFVACNTECKRQKAGRAHGARNEAIFPHLVQ